MSSKRLRNQVPERRAEGILTIRLSRDLPIPLLQAGSCGACSFAVPPLHQPRLSLKTRLQKHDERSAIHLSHAGSRPRPIRASRRCWITSICPSTRTPRSACSASTVPGKSTLLRIMAGIDKEFTGEGWVAEGARVGYLEQEPQLDPTKTVRENVMEGVAAKKALLDRYNEIASTTRTKPPTRWRSCRTRSTARISGISTARSTWRWMRCAVRRTMPT